jgi:hypothetical protein
MCLLADAPCCEHFLHDRQCVVAHTPADVVDLRLGFGTQVVATFTDPAGASDTSDYSATIDWGDGSSPTSGTINYLGGSSFNVTAAHDYTGTGPYIFTVTLDWDAEALVLNGRTGVPATGSAFVALKHVSSTVVVGSFTPSTGAVSTDYTATIDWGDGTQSAGSIDSNFNVSGTHTYNAAGSYAVSFQVENTGAEITGVGVALGLVESLTDDTQMETVAVAEAAERRDGGPREIRRRKWNRPWTGHRR